MIYLSDWYSISQLSVMQVIKIHLPEVLFYFFIVDIGLI